MGIPNRILFFEGFELQGPMFVLIYGYWNPVGDIHCFHLFSLPTLPRPSLIPRELRTTSQAIRCLVVVIVHVRGSGLLSCDG